MAKEHRNPALTVDIIIELPQGIVLIERKNAPHGWAIPGGYVDYGESVENAARREAKEETNLDVTLIELLGVYSDPARDHRQHTATVVYVATATGQPRAADDAQNICVTTLDALPKDLAFDHALILRDYENLKSLNKRPTPR